jgi:hypothetical protein
MNCTCPSYRRRGVDLWRARRDRWSRRMAWRPYSRAAGAVFSRQIAVNHVASLKQRRTHNHSTNPGRQRAMTNFLRSMRLAMVIALSIVVSSQLMDRLAAAEVVEQLQQFIREANAAEHPGEREALREEIRRLQESLGGPQVDQFQSLREQGFGVPGAPGRSRDAQSSIPRDAIRALRDAAAHLDVVANRLEQLELFTQADDLRQQAQRLRVDARGMSGVQPAPALTPGPRPAAWGEPQLDLQQLWRENAPAPRDEPTPSRSFPEPRLEPVPQPEIPSDPPKPQPLLDSPESTPQPDVEVEG